MEKIQKALLELKFPTLDVTSLLEVINATKNPVTATEILCGLYEAPALPNKVQDKEGKVLSLISYDKWENRVKYQYKKNKTISAYFREGTKKSQVLELAVFNALKEDYVAGTDQEYITINTGETVPSESTCSLEHWLDCTAIETKEDTMQEEFKPSILDLDTFER